MSAWACHDDSDVVGDDAGEDVDDDEDANDDNDDDDDDDDDDEDDWNMPAWVRQERALWSEACHWTWNELNTSEFFFIWNVSKNTQLIYT